MDSGSGEQAPRQRCSPLAQSRSVVESECLPPRTDEVVDRSY